MTKKRNQIIVYSFQKIAFRFRIDITDKRTTFLLCSWIIVKLSCVSYRVWKSLLNYRDVFFASMDMSSFLRCVLSNCRFGDSRISFHSAPVLPSWGLFIRQGDGFSLLKALWALARLQKGLPARFRIANVARRRFYAVSLPFSADGEKNNDN